MKDFLRRVAALIVGSVFLFIFSVIALFTRPKKFRGSLSKPRVWYRLPVPGVVGSDGKPLPLYAKRGEGEDLVVFFAGGGAAWNAETAARPMSVWSMLTGAEAYYFPKIYHILEGMFTGALSPKDSKNPFVGWNMFYLPYATGDFHMGDTEMPYTSLKGQEKIMFFKGASNSRIGLERAKQLFPNVKRLFIMGDSAGAFGCAAMTPLVASFWPEAESVYVYSDGSQISAAYWREVVRDIWKAPAEICEELGREGELYVDLLRYADKAMNGRAVFLRSNTAIDDVLTRFQNKMRHDKYGLDDMAIREFREGLSRSERLLEQSGISYYPFITAHNKNKKIGTTQHTMIRNSNSFYSEADAGISLAEWLGNAADGKFQSVTCI
ncbi:MAG: pectinacetylesterase family protein [Oscillospiraceae bacterium]|jgi:hypothetical protein|nr:pectinacetylesterase family protein [Oscillospiraceae bacterium]